MHTIYIRIVWPASPESKEQREKFRPLQLRRLPTVLFKGMRHSDYTYMPSIRDRVHRNENFVEIIPV